MKLLIVDDEPDVTESLKAGLERNGFTVETYNDPAKAVARYAPGSYDLVLLDIRMPGMSGFDVYRELMKKDDHVRICFLTAFEVYFEEFKKIFPNVGVQLFLKKPITIRELVGQLNRILAKVET